MNTLLKENKYLSNKPLTALILFLYLLLLIPFLGNVAFDAVVHFVVAERFSEGNFFIYNLHDTEKVVASTSPFWTFLLTIIFKLTGHLAPFVIKSVSIILWIATGYLLFTAARKIWELDGFALLAVLLFWFANVSIIKNSLGCLENILCAFQLLLLYIYLFKKRDKYNFKVSIYTGLLTGWIILTRVDAGALALLIVFGFLLSIKDSAGSRSKNILSSALIILFISFIVLLPWYIFQYSYTLKILTDSSVARLYTGRRNSIALLNGLIYFHTNALTVLFTAFLPLTIGLIYNLTAIRVKEMKKNSYRVISLLMVIFSVIAYTFIVGADQFGRYFLICMPFFLLAGINGLRDIYRAVFKKSKSIAAVFITLNIVFLFSVNIYDYYKRVVNIEQIESNIFEAYLAPGNRKSITSEYLKKLGFNETDTIKLAITEVQFRYFVDDRVNVISLDGRSSAGILGYMENNGMPDFESFIEDLKPDIVEVKGWNYEGNLLNEWNNMLSNMNIGESFMWKNNKVTYVTPWHVKIKYNVR